MLKEQFTEKKAELDAARYPILIHFRNVDISLEVALHSRFSKNLDQVMALVEETFPGAKLEALEAGGAAVIKSIEVSGNQPGTSREPSGKQGCKY